MYKHRKVIENSFLRMLFCDSSQVETENELFANIHLGLPYLDCKKNV